LNLIEYKITKYLVSNRHNSPTAIWTTKSEEHQAVLKKRKRIVKL
jgi:hypothetical protein